MFKNQASPRNSGRALFILPLGLVAISFSSIFIKICEAPPLIIAAYRLALATLVLLLFTLLLLAGLS